ncbi:MAG: hypothetical protein DYH06_19445, partial [Acidobacteria bacterium ACB2]|nr:hypothetical protein [Acidobacteria bacterium ACB2]
ALLAAAAGAACGRGAASADPSLTPQTCAGEWQVVVTSERNRRILVIEQGPTVRRTVIGEVLGRTSNAWAVNPAVGVHYTAVDAETGELYAAESRHPRGYTARQVRIVRQCVIQTEPDTTAPGAATRR